MADSQPSSSSATGSTGDPHSSGNYQPTVHAADIVETERSIQSLQSQLERSLEAGDVSGSGLLAQQVAQFKQQLRAQRQQVAASREREKEERQWESAQLHKIHAIKAVVEERRTETEAIKRSLRQQLTGQQQQQQSGGGGNSAASSFFSSVFSKDSHSPPVPWAQSAPPLDELLQRARKSVKETQVTLEKQTLIVDSVDMNGHPSTLHAATAPPGTDEPTAPPQSSLSLSSIKAIRKDTVQLIQSHLSHVDELERHMDALDACLAFLARHIPPPIQRPASSQRQQQQQRTSSSGSSRGAMR